MAMKSVKYIELDDQKGILYSAGKQSLLMPVTFIRSIDSIFSRLAGRKEADILIYIIGKGLGTEYARTLKAILRKEQASISMKTKIQMACNAIFMESGWGLANVQKIDMEKQIMDIKLRRAPSNEFLKESEYSLERGILAGMYEAIAGQEVYCGLLKSDKEKHEIVLRVSKNIPATAEKQENLALVARQELKQNISELQKLRKNLDEKVKKRTFELQIAKEIAETEKNRTAAIIANLIDGLIFFDAGKKPIISNRQADIFLDDGKNADLLFGLLENKSKIFRQEIRVSDKLILEASTVPISTSETTSGMLMILHDVTREKMIEKMKTEFVSIAAHQLRTPLSAMKWSLNFLKQGDAGELNGEQKNLIEKSRESNERMIVLINDLLNTAKIEEGRYLCELSPANFENLAQTALDSRKELAEKLGVKIKLSKPENPIPEVMLDSEKIIITMQNLIENAVKYTKKGGEIKISVEQNDDKIKFSVKDNGIGISEKQQKRLFTKFFRSGGAITMETDGSGLGLFIAKNIIEAHGGKIWCESEENKGSVFSFLIPIKNSTVA